ncbi:hypothetical protein ILUMI_07553, partial [Ignelater luminosus]
MMDQALIAKIPESVRLPFLNLTKFGLFSTNKFKAYIPMTILSLIVANIIFVAILQFINVKRDISDIVRNLEDILALSLVLVRIVIVTYCNEDFTRLIQMTKLFWDPSKFGKQTEVEIISMRRFTSQLQRLFFVTGLIAAVLILIFPLLHNTIPLGIWTLKDHAKLYLCLMIGQVIAIPFSAFFVICLDCMYLGFCTEIVIQFRILSQYLQVLKAESNTVKEMEINRLNKIKSCVSHHRLILWFVKEFRQTFSLLLLFEFVLDGPLICAELLAVFE